MYIGSIVFLLLGIAGLYGSMKGGKDKKGSPFLLALYSIGIFIFFIGFLGASIFFFVGPRSIFGTDCQSSGQINLIKDLYLQSEQTSKTFCKSDGPTGSCPCYIPDDDAHKDLRNALSSP